MAPETIDTPADQFSLKIPVRWEVLLFVILFSLAVFLRLYHLEADAPHRITFSMDIETDPPQYTVFARNAILTGDWNPYHDNRYITYLYSLVSAAGWLVYKLAGTGTFQTNLTAVLLSLTTILLFYFIVRRGLGNGVAVLTLLFIAVNFLGIFYGRKPFLENGMNLLFILGLFFLTFFERHLIGHFLFGLFFAAAIFFGKIIALGFLGVPAVYYAYQWLYLKDPRTLGRAAIMAGGFLAIFVFWFMVIFTPHHEQVTGYVGEQALGLYGVPEALQSPGKFIWRFLTFGKESEFFDRMSALSIGAAALLIILTARLFPPRGEKKVDVYRNGIFIALAAWLVSTYLSQMPWNYQPARFQTAMIFPMAAMGGALVACLHRQRDVFNFLHRGLVFQFVLFVNLLLVIYQLGGNVVVAAGGEFHFKNWILYVLAVVLVLIGPYIYLCWKKPARELTLTPAVRYGAVALMLLIFLWHQGKNYLSWAGNLLYTTRDASRDLATILSPEAIVSGPFGPALVQENNLGCIIHIFGTSRPDPDLFRKFPVTHLALEKPNEKVAREIYPEVMNMASTVAHYYVNCVKLTVYRIAFATGNPKAMTYFPSNYEKALMFYRRDVPDSGDFYLDRFLRLNPENLTGNVLKAYYAQKRGDWDRAILYYKRAVDFSPTDFNLHFLLGQAYSGKAEATGDEKWRELAHDEGRLATELDLGYYDFDEYIDKPIEGDTIESFNP